MADKPSWQWTADDYLNSLVTPATGSSIGGLTVGSTGTGTTVTGTTGASTAQVPGASTGFGFGDALGWLGDNSQGLGSLLQGIGALSSIFTTNKQIGLAEDNLNFQKEAYNTNLANQISTYNTNLEDRIRGRYSTADQSEAQIQSYLDKNKLSK